MLSPFLRFFTLKSTLLAASISLAMAHSGSAAEIEPLKKSTLVEVINEVKILQGKDLTPVPAEEAMLFSAPDFLETGRRSRARLEADDGTITRVGSNTLFSFDQASRSINLDRGSLLFHSPEGRGGGRVVTASATASVLGTTIMTVATADGGFKVLVLEGTAQVDFPDGTRRILTAGQMTFVLPERPAGSGVKDAGNGSEDPGSEQPAGKPGPVLNFELSRLTPDSNLLNGFSENLPSQTKIESATREQIERISSGKLDSTDALIITADGEDSVILNLTNEKETLTSSIESNQNLTPGQQRLQAALQSTVNPNEVNFPEENFFDAPGVLPFPEFFDGALFDSALNEPVTGFVAGRINFTGGTLDLGPIALTDTSPTRYFIGGKDAIRFAGDNILESPHGGSLIAISTLGQFEWNEGGSIQIVESTNDFVATAEGGSAGVEDFSQGTHLSMNSEKAFTMAGFGVTNNYGSINLSAREGVELQDSSITADHYSTEGTTTGMPPGSIMLFSKDAVSIDNSTLNASGSVGLNADNLVRVNSGEITGSFIEMRGKQVEIVGAQFFPAYSPYSDGAYFEAVATELAELSGVNLANLSGINIAGRTVNLANVDFPSNGQVRLGSEAGMLAENPNTGASSVAGHVNFIENVKVAGNLAQQYVPKVQQVNPAEELVIIEELIQIYSTSNEQ